MRKGLLIACLLVGITGSVSAQHDDLYFVPKKKKVMKEVGANQTSSQKEDWQMAAEAAPIAPARQLEMDEDAYNRRGAYRAEQGDAIEAESIVVITEDGDTMQLDTDTLRLARVAGDEGWVNGFEGSDSDYEYAMRIVRFRNPRYAIPVSSPLYWDVVYGGALWPSWEWNVYDDGMYAYVFPTSSNWHYWDYMMSYPFGWSAWNSPWAYHHGFHWGHHWNSHYAHVWYDPCFGPGWHYGHHHHGFHPGFGNPSWRQPKAHPNYRSAMAATTRRSGQTGNVATQRIDNGSSRNVSSRSTVGRAGTVSRSSSAASSSRSSSRTAVGDDVIRRSTGSSSVSRSTSNGSSRSNSSYSRPSSTRSSSSSVSRSSSSGSSRSSSYSSGSSSSSRSSSYSSGSSSRSSSYSSGGGARSGGSSSRSSGSRR